MNVTYEERLLGSAGTLRANRTWIGNDDAFWIFYGDVLTNVHLENMLAFHTERRPIVTLGLYEVSNPEQCGIVSVDDDSIAQDFVEEPTKPSENLAFSGVMVGTAALLDEIPDRSPVDLGFDVLRKLRGRMAAYQISEYVVDIGTPAAHEYAQQSWPGLVAGSLARVPC